LQESLIEDEVQQELPRRRAGLSHSRQRVERERALRDHGSEMKREAGGLRRPIEVMQRIAQEADR
jgi:hypothetical protein